MGCTGDDLHATGTLANLIQLEFEGSDLDVLAPVSNKLGTVHYLINGKVAKIGTHVDQVVDVFYVTDSAGNKITDTDRLAEIEHQIREAIDGLSV